MHKQALGSHEFTTITIAWIWKGATMLIGDNGVPLGNCLIWHIQKKLLQIFKRHYQKYVIFNF
jgi:hypothetical protein